MSKTTRLLRLVHLLSHRRVVSMETIRAVCGIPERSIYRYLNDISEANIPVYYDRDLHGYRLTDGVDVKLDGLRLQEMVLLVTAVSMLHRHVEPAYQQELAALRKKLLSRQPLPLEAALGPNLQETVVSEPNYTEAVSWTLVQTAAHLQCETTVKTVGDDGEVDCVFEHPCLHFSNGWRVVESGLAESGVPLNAVTSVCLSTPSAKTQFKPA